jgi:glycosyltransferase involved in cell wall biosynthesis
MRVALVTHSFPPAGTGLARAAWEIASSLRATGHEVCVFASDRERSSSRNGYLDVVGFAPPSGSLRAVLRRVPIFGALLQAGAAWRAVRDAHSNHPFDVVEASNWRFLGLFLGFFPIAPFVTRNSTSIVDMRPQHPATIRDRLEVLGIDALFALERASARASKVLISNSRTHRDRIADLYGLSDAVQMHLVVHLSLPPVIAERAHCFAPPPDSGPPVNLFFVGRATERKGFDVLVEAFEALDAAAARGEIPNFHLRLVGVSEAEVIARLRGRPAPGANSVTPRRIEALGHVEEAALHALYYRAHIVVAPSRYESFGLVYWEAMAFGRPIVACAVDPCAVDFIETAEAGLLASRCDVASLCRTIEMLLRDPQLRLRLGENGRRAARQLSRKALAEGTLQAYAAAVLRRGCRQS